MNEPLYSAKAFTKYGIQVHDYEYPDGSCPDDEMIMDFIKLCDSEIMKGGAVAVHCRAGLGRTGSLIGCYLMKKYSFTGKSAIAWLRICRPGSVIGVQ